MMCNNMTKNQLENLINVRRVELGKLFEKYGLNNFTLRKSQELDVLVTEVQKKRLKQI